MIQGDRSYLKASLTRGILDMQNRLIKLYVVNLQAIGTQAAFIAGFSFLGIGSIILPKTGSSWNGLHWLFDFFIHLTFCLCLWATSHATLITVYAPSTALKGVEFETVNSVARMIQKQKYFVLWIGVLALTCLFIASIMNYWAKFVWQVSFIVTIINIVGFGILSNEALKVYNIFHPDQEVYFSDLLGEYAWRSPMSYTAPRKRSRTTSDENHFESDQHIAHANEWSDEAKSEVSVRTRENDRGGKSSTRQRKQSTGEYIARSKEIMDHQQLTQTRARGMIWWKSLISLGGDGKFHFRFAVIEKGLLNFYLNEEAFNSNDHPLNLHPYQIWQYRLETDYSRFPKGITSGVKSIRKRVIGQGEFSLYQVMSSEYDLKDAVNRFRFALLSQISSELTHLDPIELMANNEEQYNLWINAFSKIISGYRFLDSIKEAAEEEYTLSGNASIEVVVKAANSKL